MKPTVGRAVHLYAKEGLLWQSIGMSPPFPSSYIGPFAATIVFVHPSGTVNLNYAFPSVCRGSDKTSAILENVREIPAGWHKDGAFSIDTALAAAVAKHGTFWMWPPREGT